MPPTYDENTDLPALEALGLKALFIEVQEETILVPLMPDGGNSTDPDDQAQFLFSIFQDKRTMVRIS